MWTSMGMVLQSDGRATDKATIKAIPSVFKKDKKATLGMSNGKNS